jgi:hypothetical protein
MSNQPFPYYIEDWILWLGRSKDAQGNDIDFPYYKTWPVKLANYDVTFITRSTDSIRKGVGFTQRQLEMATKIVTKYQRQIQKKINRDVGYLSENTPHRLVLREVDRSFSLVEQGNYYHVKFPYDPKLVDRMHEFSSMGTGDFRWDKPRRQWNVAKTERNLALLADFVENCNQQAWYIAPSVAQHIAEINQVRSNPYLVIPHIELIDNSICVVNSNPSLDAGLAEHGFSLTNDIPNTVFSASSFGLSVGPILTKYLNTHYSSIVDALLLTQNEIFLKANSFESCLNISNLELFMKTICAKKWIFVNFMSGTEFSQVIDHAANIDVPGKKVFFTFNGMSRNGEKIMHEVYQEDLSDTVIIADNTSLLRRYLNTTVSPNAERLFFIFARK